MPSAKAVSTVTTSEARILSPRTEPSRKSMENSPRCIDDERRDAKTPAMLPRILMVDGRSTIRPGIRLRTSRTEPR